MFTLIGSDGKTAEHNCRADRSKGATDSCTIRDTAKIGKLKSMKVKNTSDNKWVFVAASVEVDGVLRGRWAGSTTVNDYQTKTIVFTYIGQEISSTFFLNFLVLNISSSTKESSWGAPK